VIIFLQFTIENVGDMFYWGTARLYY